MLYVDNPLQSILANNVKVTDSKTLLGDGGVYYVKNSASITLSETTPTKSYYKTIHALSKGSFMYSDAPSMILSISDTDIECSTVAINTATFSTVWSMGGALTFSDRGGAFYIKNVAT
jgi:hypothetical protein